MRRWSDDTGLLAIDRDNEHWNSVRAAETGVGAPVVAYLPEHNAMVLEFIEGRTMSAEELRAGGHIARVADACRRLHAAERFRDDFDMFEIQPRYLGSCRRAASACPTATSSSRRRSARSARRSRVREEPTVPCNNDLLAENFILAGDEFRLIDYEYSGNNDACFELGNVWSESNLSLAQLEELVAAYYGRALRHKVARARLWGLMSKYGWTLWASIQDGVSTSTSTSGRGAWRSTTGQWRSSTRPTSSASSRRRGVRTERPLSRCSRVSRSASGARAVARRCCASVCSRG